MPKTCYHHSSPPYRLVNLGWASSPWKSLGSLRNGPAREEQARRLSLKIEEESLYKKAKGHNLSHSGACDFGPPMQQFCEVHVRTITSRFCVTGKQSTERLKIFCDKLVRKRVNHRALIGFCLVPIFLPSTSVYPFMLHKETLHFLWLKGLNLSLLIFFFSIINCLFLYINGFFPSLSRSET